MYEKFYRRSCPRCPRKPNIIHQVGSSLCQANSFLDHRVCAPSPLPELWESDFFGWNLALWLRIYMALPSSTSLSQLWLNTTDHPVRQLRSDSDASGGKMRLTPRCLDLLKLLRTARWLTTAQIHRRFFPAATADAVRKRLRKLSAGRYLFAMRRDRMSQTIFTVGKEGKRILERLSGETIVVERKPPTQREHFLAINDLRIAAELTGKLKFFYAAWELPGLGWNQAIIPDCLVALDDRIFAIEFDRGVEGVLFFVRTKMTAYQRGFDNIALAAVLIVADRVPRMLSLAKAIGNRNGKVLFSTLELVIGHPLSAPIFYSEPGGWGVSISSQTLPSSREFSTSNSPDVNDLVHFEHGLLRKEGAEHAKDSDQ
jgi:hypothetical protein